mgnify:CR=1 FL=1
MKHEIKKEISYDGILKEEYEYLSEEKVKNGLSKHYDSLGNLEEESFYKLGKKHGKSKEYYHGEWKAEGNYSEGKKDGIWLIKNYNGKVRKVLYINGIEQELEQEKINNILKPQKIKYEIPKVFILLVLMSIITIFTLILWEENNNLQKRLEKENVAERIFDFPEPYLKTKEE